MSRADRQRGQIHHKRILEAVERHDPEMARQRHALAS